MRQPVDLARCYRLLNHGPTTLISAAARGQRNVMAAAWVMPVDFSPPKLAAVLAQDTFTRELIDASGELVVAIPTASQLALVDAVGTASGRDGDKFARFSIATSPASIVAAPLIEGCAAWLECRVLPEPHAQSTYDLFLLEAVAAWADDQVFAHGRWLDDLPDARRTIHHIAGGAYALTGRTIQAPR